MSIINIQRDGVYIEPDSTVLVWPAAFSLSGDPLVNAETAVKVDYGSIGTAPDGFVTINSSQGTCVGMYFQNPNVERQPFRIKCYLGNSDSQTAEKYGAIVIGYAPASITGTGDSISGSRWIPFLRKFDDLVIVEPELAGETYEARALFIGVSVLTSVTLSADKCHTRLSVQNLGVKPPTMQNAVS